MGICYSSVLSKTINPSLFQQIEVNDIIQYFVCPQMARVHDLLSTVDCSLLFWSNIHQLSGCCFLLYFVAFISLRFIDTVWGWYRYSFQTNLIQLKTNCIIPVIHMISFLKIEEILSIPTLPGFFLHFLSTWYCGTCEVSLYYELSQ